MTETTRPSLGLRLRSAFSVRLRLLLLFVFLLSALAAMALMFNRHVEESLAIEAEFEAAQDELAVYNEAQDAVLQFRIFILRAALFASVTPEADNSDQLQRLAVAEMQLQQKLNALAALDARESEALRSPLPDPTAVVERVRALAKAGRKNELASLLLPINSRFNELHQRLLDSRQRTQMRTLQVRRDAGQLHREKLQQSALLLAGILLSSILLTYLGLRSVVLALRDTMQTLHSIPAHAPGTHSAANTGDEFDQMHHALERLRESTAELNRLAYVHPLTGLPNNVRLQETLGIALEEARQLKVGIALLFVDLNDFRAVNDAIGHDTGDACLRELAQRLRSLIAPREAVYHFSGDLFAVHIEAPEEQLRQLSDTLGARIHKAILEPVEAAGRSLRLTASIGVAVFPDHADDARSLISAADAAVHLAKRQGRDNTQMASRDLAQRADVNLKLTEDIQRGLRASEFVPYFEPIIDLDTDRMVGAEALLRWKHPQQGVLRPARFLDVAEQTGQLYPMTASAFRKACAEVAQWPDHTYLTFNLSPRQIRPALASVIRRVLAETGLPPERLEFEITENALMDRVEQVAYILSELRDLGVRLSLDDFGTGYSSLSYLQRLPVNKLKIDRSFVSRLDSSRASQAIINAMLGIARNLHLEVVAEGVETVHQLEILRAMGCRYVQGYLFSAAVPAEDLLRWSQMPPSRYLAERTALH